MTATFSYIRRCAETLHPVLTRFPSSREVREVAKKHQVPHLAQKTFPDCDIPHRPYCPYRRQFCNFFGFTPGGAILSASCPVAPGLLSLPCHETEMMQMSALANP